MATEEEEVCSTQWEADSHGGLHALQVVRGTEEGAGCSLLASRNKQKENRSNPSTICGPLEMDSVCVGSRSNQ